MATLAHTTDSVGGKMERDWEIKLRWHEGKDRYALHVWIPEHNHWICCCYIPKERVKDLLATLDSLYSVGGEE